MVEELVTHKGATCDEKTQRQHRAVAAMLSDIAGTDDLRLIRHAHLAAYMQTLSNLPESYGKSSRDAALSIADLVERGRTMRVAGQTENGAQPRDREPAYHAALDDREVLSSQAASDW